MPGRPPCWPPRPSGSAPRPPPARARQSQRQVGGGDHGPVHPEGRGGPARGQRPGRAGAVKRLARVVAVAVARRPARRWRRRRRPRPRPARGLSRPPGELAGVPASRGSPWAGSSSSGRRRSRSARPARAGPGARPLRSRRREAARQVEPWAPHRGPDQGADPRRAARAARGPRSHRAHGRPAGGGQERRLRLARGVHRTTRRGSRSSTTRCCASAPTTCATSAAGCWRCWPASAGPVDVPAGSILIAEELTPSETAEFDRDQVLGFCTTTGGATSHVAILARSLGIPAVCGIDDAALAAADGHTGRARRHPRLAAAAARREPAHAVRQRIASPGGPARGRGGGGGRRGPTRDGHRVEVVANIRNPEDAREAVAQGAEGVGLLRSEFLFVDRDTPPERRRAGRRPTRPSRGARARSAASSSARSTSAATSRSPTCRCRRRTTRSSACAASASASTDPTAPHPAARDPAGGAGWATCT